MQRHRSGKIHPIVICVLLVGAIAGVYVRYADWAAKKAEEKQALEDAKPRARGNPLDPTEFLKTNPRPERETPYKYLFSDTASTLSELPGSGSEYDSKPWSPADYNAGSKAYWLEVVEHFRLVNKDKSTDLVDNSSQLLKEVVSAIHVGPESNLKPFRERLTILLREPAIARDPLFQYFAGLVLTETGESLAARQLFYGATVDHSKRDYPSRCVVANLNSRIGLGSERLEEVSIYEDLADAIVGWLKYDFSETPAQQRFCWGILKDSILNFSNASKLEIVKQILDKNASDAFLSPWLAEMMAGEYFYRLALAGGSKQENLEESSQHFQKAWEIQTAFPESIVGLINVASAAGENESTEQWFKRAEDAGVVDYLVIDSMLRSYDSPQERLEFAMECYRKQQFETSIPFALVSAYRTNRSEVSDPETIESVIDCLGKLAANPAEKYLGKQEISRDWMQSVQAVIAINSGQHDIASKALNELGDRFDSRVVGEFADFKNFARRRAITLAKAGATDQLRQIIDNLEMLVQAQLDGEDTCDEIQSVLEGLTPEQQQLPLLNSVATMCRKLNSFSTGDWVKLGFDNELLNWESATESQLAVDSAASITISTLTGENHAFVMSDFYTPGPKAIELEVEFPISRDPYDAEIVIGDWRDYGTSAAITIDPVRQRLGFGSTVFNGNVAKLQFNDAEPLEEGELRKFNLSVNIANGYVEIFADGQFVLRSTSSRIVPSSRIGFGVNGYGKTRGKVRFSKIRVKQWDAVPPLGEPEKLAEHFSNLTKRNPEDFNAWFARGLAELNNLNVSAARTHIEKALQLGLPRIQAAPYLGDIADREGDSQAANQLYRFVYERLSVKPFELLQKEDRIQSHDRFQVAAARYLWNELTNPQLDHAARNAFIEGLEEINEGNSPVGSDTQWIQQRLQAQIAAIKAQAFADEAVELKKIADAAALIVEVTESEKGEQPKTQQELEQEQESVRAAKKLDLAKRSFEQELARAKQAIGKAIETAPSEFKADLEQQRDAINNQQPYSRDPGLPRQYLGQDSLRCFPTLRDWLRPDWQEIYR